MYSQPPSQRDAGVQAWTWTLASPEANRSRSKYVTITVPLGNGERITAFLQNSQGPSLFKQVGNYNIDLSLSLRSLLLGWLGYMAATLSLLLMLRWYGRKVNFRWRAVWVALLLPSLPLLEYVDVSRYDRRLPISTVLLLIIILLSGVFFRRALRSMPLRGHQPALTGRSVGVASWLPLVSLPLVAFALAALVPPDNSTSVLFGPPETGARRLLTALNITAVLLLIWVVSALVLMFTRSALRAVSASTTPNGSLAVTGGIGAEVVRWYQIVAGAVIVVSAYAVGYGLANPLGKALSAYRAGAASAASASTQLATDIGNMGIYPVMFLLLPVAATLIAATISSTMPASAMTVEVVATASLAWAATSRALDLNVVGTSLPVGTWILTALVALSLRKPLRDNSSGQAEPWLPIRLSRWLAQEKHEIPTDSAPPGTLVQRGPFSDAHARANLALAWATLLSVIPVAYLVWGTLIALPKNGSQPIETSFVVSQAVTEVVRWTLTGWLYGLLLPMLPGRVGPVKALWLSGAWFAASAPVAIVNIWTGADPGRVWLFPGLQLLLFLTVLGVLTDLSTIRAWAGAHSSLATNWSTLLKVYNFEGTRKVVLYAAPAVAAVIAIGQQVVSGTGLDFVNSLLSGAQSLLGGR